MRELKTFGLHDGAHPVGRILDDAGIHPTPERQKSSRSCHGFERAHRVRMVACLKRIASLRTVIGAALCYPPRGDIGDSCRNRIAT